MIIQLFQYKFKNIRFIESGALYDNIRYKYTDMWIRTDIMIGNNNTVNGIKNQLSVQWVNIIHNYTTQLVQVHSYAGQ